MYFISNLVTYKVLSLHQQMHRRVANGLFQPKGLTMTIRMICADRHRMPPTPAATD